MEREIGPLVYTVAEAARLFKVSPTLVRRTVRKGELRAIRMGDRILIPRGEIERLVGEAA